MISLAPPRNPTGARKDRNWTLVISHEGTCVADHISLYGTHAGDPTGAQAAANTELGQDYTWLANGPGFRAESETE